LPPPPPTPPNPTRPPCRGAAQGEGLGNSFLANISAVDGIFHVCRAFEDPDVIHVEDRIDPVADLDIIHAELRAKDTTVTTAFVDVSGQRAGPGRAWGSSPALGLAAGLLHPATRAAPL
jgi:hypothetical protein